jgi:hypothetical protein
MVVVWGSWWGFLVLAFSRMNFFNTLGTSAIVFSSSGSGETINLVNSSPPPPPPIATGGIVTTYTSDGVTYTVHTFLASGTFTLNSDIYVDVLLVGGGGSGSLMDGFYVGTAGGGGGQVIESFGVSLYPQAYSVVVGDGGYIGNSTTTTPSASTAFGLTALPGSNGPMNIAKGGDSGSGYTGGDNAYIPDQYGNIYLGGGGGGGDGENGFPGSGNNGGNGGGGSPSSISGTFQYYGGGGGGGAVPSGNFTTIPGTGGLGGGGNGSNTRNTDRQSQCDGTPNTGGGGGGVATSRYFGSFTPGSGAAGIVVVRYIQLSA